MEFRLLLSRIINTDILYNENVTVVSDAHKLPFKSESFDSIISQAVLEHLTYPICNKRNDACIKTKWIYLY